MKRIPLGLIYLLIVGCGKVAPLPPGGFEVQAVLNTDVLHVGDPVTLTQTARHPTGSRIVFPTVGNGKKVVAQNRSRDTRSLSDTILQTEETLQLTSFRVGDWAIATNPVACIFSDGTEKTERLSELTLRVQSTLTQTNQTTLSDIQDIVTPPLQIPRWLWISTLVILLAAALAFAIRYFRESPNSPFTPEPIIPPHLIAQAALAALRNELWAPEPFFVKLSSILRTYLENRFDLNAPESTTEELAEKLSPEHKEDLRDFFTQADLVKFARADAEQAAMQAAFQTITQFVEQTAEHPVTNEEPQNEKI